MIWRIDGTGSRAVLPSNRYPPRQSVTVDAWVRSDGRLAGLQPLVSRWTLRSDFDAFAAFDAGVTAGLVTKGFFGAVFDGRYIYYVPTRRREERDSVHGCVLRYDTHRPFDDAASYESFDAGHTDGLRTAGFYGAVFDGRYVNFIPRDDGVVHHSRFLRYDTTAPFTDQTSWSAHDAEHAHSFQGAAFDGRYIYCCPGLHNPAGGVFADAVESGVVMRVDSHAPFRDHARYATFDAQTVDERAVCYDGAAFDGRYVYFAPLSDTVVLRFDTCGEFDNRDSWATFDGGSIGLAGCVGAICDGRYVYFVPFASGRVVRLDTEASFTDVEAWQTMDAAAALGFAPAGYKGGFFDGRYVTFVPFRGTVPAGSTGSSFHGNCLRYDTTAPFEASGSWMVRDAGFTDGMPTSAYTAGASDGRYLYAAPWRGDVDDGGMHGRILRHDTLGDGGGFSLRAGDDGHNGGLGGALPGPSFLINTDAGPFSVRADRLLPAGWHHLAGVYDGGSMALYVDGERVAAGPARGRLLGEQEPIAIGHIADGSAHFTGEIGEAMVDTVAHDEDAIRRRYGQLVDARSVS